MRCVECGADLPGHETCLDRFHALLAAEMDAEGNYTEAWQAHGLTVMTFYLQHAGGSGYNQRWMVEGAEDALRKIFGEGRDVAQVLPAGQRAARQKAVRTIKSTPNAHDPVTSRRGPQGGEITIAALDPTNLQGHFERVMQWARSVAEHRVLTG